MDSDEWPDWLPFDWTIDIRKIDQRTVKCYVYEGHKCYSKAEVLDYLKKMNQNTANAKTQKADGSTVDLAVDLDAPGTNASSEAFTGGRPTKLTPRPSRRKSQTRVDLSEEALAGLESSSEPLSSRKRNGDSNWLPEGWTEELRPRKAGNGNGSSYKVYTDPVSGQKFFSKPQVLKHLSQINISAGGQKKEATVPASATMIWQEESIKEPDNSQPHEAIEVKKDRTRKKTESVTRMPYDYKVISRTPVEELPDGWIKEVRMRVTGPTKRQDAYYLDPLSEYGFMSKKDAWRYLESGDIKSCAMKPIRRGDNRDVTGNVNLTSSKEELTSPDPSKGAETPKDLPNGSAEELKTNESDTPNPKPIRSISGGSFNIPNEENPDWLPDGWVTEVHYKASGMKYKIFKEVVSGKKFFSKPQVLHYLAGGSSSKSRKKNPNSSPNPTPGDVTLPVKPDSSANPTPVDVTLPKRSAKKKGNIESSDQSPAFQEVITSSQADGLPPGWIKEIRTKIYATHKRNDPFYIDPVSGYIFRSKMDALRYLDSGDVNLCALKPKVKDKDGKEVYVITNNGQNPVTPATGRRLFEDKEDDLSTENDEIYQTTDPKISNSRKRKASTRIANRSINTAASSAARTSERKKGVAPATEPTSTVVTEGNGAVEQATWVDLEKQPAPEPDDGKLSFDIPEDDGWSIDFAVKTLSNEILFNGGDTTGVNDTPSKVN